MINIEWLNSKKSSFEIKSIDKKLFEVKGSIQAAKEGVISKKEALKEYNDKLGSSIGYAKDLKQAEELTDRLLDFYIKEQERIINVGNSQAKEDLTTSGNNQGK